MFPQSLWSPLWSSELMKMWITCPSYAIWFYHSMHHCWATFWHAWDWNGTMCSHLLHSIGIVPSCLKVTDTSVSPLGLFESRFPIVNCKREGNLWRIVFRLLHISQADGFNITGYTERPAFKEPDITVGLLGLYLIYLGLLYYKVSLLIIRRIFPVKTTGVLSGMQCS